MSESDQATRRTGVIYALSAYAFWGVAPVYFVLVRFAGPLEVLAHRVVWSVPLLALLITIGRQWGQLRNFSRRTLLGLGVCALLLSVNWATYIYAIQLERIAEAALGYYINPLISILLGFVVLGEKLRPLQWVAAAIVFGAVIVELVLLGSLPWFALLLAITFAIYGLLRKQLAVPSSAGLGVETALIAPFALLFLLFAPSIDWAARSTSDIAMLAFGGAVTVTPLIWFGAAAARLPLVSLGFFQYLGPSITLVLAVLVYGETVAPGRWIAFGLIWLALVIFSVDALRVSRRTHGVLQ